jgi:MFS family permease
LDAFQQHIAAWQPFFITLAGIGATLAGLLFVAISLHPANKHEEAKINLRRLAEHTFADLVQVLFLSMFFIAPGQLPSFYASSIILTVAMGMLGPAKRLLEAWRDRDHTIHREHFIRRMRMSVMGRGFVFLGAVMLFIYHDTGADVEKDMILVFSGSLVLLIAAMRNAWFLILQETD